VVSLLRFRKGRTAIVFSGFKRFSGCFLFVIMLNATKATIMTILIYDVIFHPFVAIGFTFSFDLTLSTGFVIWTPSGVISKIQVRRTAMIKPMQSNTITKGNAQDGSCNGWAIISVSCKIINAAAA
jgi:FtsH-binding integral membrane protein